MIKHELLALLMAGWAWIYPVIATAQVQHGRSEPPSLRLAGEPDWITGRGAVAESVDTGPLRLAQAPSLSALDEVAPAAAPRAGQGESALLDVAPAAAPPQKNETPVPAGVLVQAQGAPAAAAEAPAALGTGLKLWAIPPIRWGGYAAVDLVGTSAQGKARQWQLTESTNLRASSYIWQPWFAQVSGELTLLGSQTRADGGGQGATAGSGTKSTSLTGGGQLSLFPMSRFPFSASYSETDSRTSGELTNNAYTSRRYGLTQNYTPPQGGSSYRLSYNRSDISSDAAGADTVQALGASMNWSGGFHALSVNGDGYTNTRGNSGDNSSMKSVNATHSYRPSSTFTVESLANFNATQYHLVNSDLSTDLRSRFLQLNSFATWRPGEDSPLRLSGGARLYQSSAGANGISSEARIISANAAATYALNRNTTLTGAGVITQTANGGASTIFSSQTAGVNYAADQRKLGDYVYTWNTGANLGYRSGGANSSSSQDARVGHRLSRNVVLGEGSSLFIDASQDYSMRNDTLFESSQSLAHSAGASWNARSGESANTLLSLRASDTHTTGYMKQHFQLVNLQASGRLEFSRWASAGANLTFQAARQVTSPAASAAGGSAPTGSSSTSTGGNLNYQHTRAFGVPRLRYYALLNINQYQVRSRLDGNIDAPVESVNWALEQRLDYDIGRLQTRLSLRVAEVGGRTNGIIFFRVLRQFGGL